MRNIKSVCCLFGLLFLLIGCGGDVPAIDAPAIDEDGSGGFEFVGIGNLPDGFDAQGHRGARGLLPENTLPAFEAALDLGVTTIELDLHFTQDGEVVVWHDPVIGKDKCRLPEGAPSDTPDPKNPLRRVMVSQQPLAVVQQYVCDINPDENRYSEQAVLDMPLANSDYGIATLAEVFEFVATYAESDMKSAEKRTNAATVQFNIETKRKADQPELINDGFTGGEAGPFELAILDLIEQYDLHGRVVVQSFDHRSLQVIREIDSEIWLAALTSRGETKVKVYSAYKFDIWSPNQNDLTPELLAEAQGLGMKVIPWTVNDLDDMQRLIEWGVDGLISDRPDLLLTQQSD